MRLASFLACFLVAIIFFKMPTVESGGIKKKLKKTIEKAANQVENAVKKVGQQTKKIIKQTIRVPRTVIKVVKRVVQVPRKVYKTIAKKIDEIPAAIVETVIDAAFRDGKTTQTLSDGEEEEAVYEEDIVYDDKIEEVVQEVIEYVDEIIEVEADE